LRCSRNRSRGGRLACGTYTCLMPKSPSGSISAAEACQIAIRAQGLALTGDRPKTVADVLRRTGAVQLDTISVLARSHELVAYARLGAVGRAAVEAAYWAEPARAFEYYAHANCIMPIEMWPYFAFRRQQLGHGVWPSLLKTGIIDEVFARLKDGPVTATDLGGARRSTAGWWDWSDAKRALEVLYARGDVICTMRRNWKRVYDLPERVLPPGLLDHQPSPQECYHHLVRAAARALGVGTRRDIARYYRLLELNLGRTLDRARLFDDALADAGLVAVEVEGWKDPAFADPASLNLRTPRAHRTELLSPFDSLIWERERTQRMFGYTFSLEAYKPKGTRIHGYFTMPLLAGGRIAGHVDPAREGRTLVARNVALHDPEAVDDMASALREAATWVGCDAVRVDRVQPRAAAGALKRALA
jgi:uncharacterized protein